MYTIVRLVLILLFTIFQSNLTFGNNGLVDSLMIELSTTSTDERKVELLLAMSKACRNSTPVESLDHAKKALGISIRIENKIFEAKSLNAIGRLHVMQGELDKGLQDLNKGLDILNQVGKDEDIQRCLNTIGSAYFRKGDNEIALEYFHKALELSDKNEEGEMVARILGNIGTIYYSEGDVDKALFYYEDVLRISRELNDPDMLTSTLMNLGAQYTKKKEYDKAIAYYKESLVFAEQTNNIRAQILVSMNLANRYSKSDLDLSLNYYKRALQCSEKIGEEGERAKIFYNLAYLQYRLKNYDEVIYYAEQALELSEKVGDKRLILRIYKLLIKYYEVNKDYKLAFDNKTIYHQIRDSLFTIEKAEKILDISTKYEAEKKEMENGLLKKKQAENEAILNLHNTIGILALLIFILMFIVLFSVYKNYRNKKSYSLNLEEQVKARTLELEDSNIQLRASNKELERFAFIASHDLKEPLRNIISFTNLLLRSISRDLKGKEDVKEYSNFIVSNTKKMNQLIVDVLEYSKVNHDVEEKQEYIETIIKSVVATLSSTIKEKNVIINIGALPKVKTNYSQIFLVLKNLIENAIKYNDKEVPILSIRSMIINGMCEISIQDNGIGIEKQYFKQIFEMFKRLHNREEYAGSGLGLSTCKKIISRMKGEIWVDSKLGEGSKFTFSFPSLSQNEKQQFTFVEEKNDLRAEASKTRPINTMLN